MSHFNQKSLIFYGIAIGSVVILFRIVIWYGTTYLKAPRSIQGQYGLTLAATPQCPQSSPLILTIQQSGIYLSGQLEVLKTDSLPSSAALTLNGKWDAPRVKLEGKLRAVNICRQPVDMVEISGTFEGSSLGGQIKSPNLPEQIAFRAQPLDQQKEQPSH